MKPDPRRRRLRPARRRLAQHGSRRRHAARHVAVGVGRRRRRDAAASADGSAMDAAAGCRRRQPRALGDRLTGRLWDYPRWLRPQRAEFDVFHIVDHSYAHLIRALPAERTIVTCNDTDAFEAARDGARRGSIPSRLLAAHVLDGISRASHVACISEATRQDLIATGRVDPSRTSVVYLGAHPTCTPAPDAKRRRRDRAATRCPRASRCCTCRARFRASASMCCSRCSAGSARMRPDARLVRVGGPLTREQQRLAERLNVLDAVVQLPFLERPQLAALYRRASVVVLPSDREGFRVAGRRSDGVRHARDCQRHSGAARSRRYRRAVRPPGDVRRWVEALAAIATRAEQMQRLASAAARRVSARPAKFDWRRYAAQMAALYLQPLARERAS